MKSAAGGSRQFSDGRATLAWISDPRRWFAVTSLVVLLGVVWTLRSSVAASATTGGGTPSPPGWVRGAGLHARTPRRRAGVTVGAARKAGHRQPLGILVPTLSRRNARPATGLRSESQSPAGMPCP